MHNAYVHSCTFIHDNEDYRDNWRKIYYMTFKTAKGFTVKGLYFYRAFNAKLLIVVLCHVSYDLHIR